MATIEEIYQAALLADAAYVTLDEEEFVPEGHATGQPQVIGEKAFDQLGEDVNNFEDRVWGQPQFNEFI
jgi:hypothetical protein